MTRNSDKRNVKHPIKDENGEIRERRTIRYDQFDVAAAEAYFAREIREPEWVFMGKSRYGENPEDWKFKCPKCGTVSTGKDFVNRGALAEKARTHCIGNFSKNAGCSWKSNGFFGTFGKGLVVHLSNNTKVEMFPFAD